MRAVVSLSIVSMFRNPLQKNWLRKKPRSYESLEMTAMTNFLFASALFVVSMVALSLFRVLYGPAQVDRMMAAQLLGSGGVAVMLLVAIATDAESIIDVALMIALLAAFASIAFVRGASGSNTGATEVSDLQ